jgi:hypothetical protein
VRKVSGGVGASAASILEVYPTSFITFKANVVAPTFPAYESIIYTSMSAQYGFLFTNGDVYYTSPTTTASLQAYNPNDTYMLVLSPTGVQWHINGSIVLTEAYIADTYTVQIQLYDVADTFTDIAYGYLFIGPTGDVGSTGVTGIQGPTGYNTYYIFDGGFPSSTYTVGPAFDAGGVGVIGNTGPSGDYNGTNLTLQFRRGLSSQWASVNPTLADGEMAIETDTDLFKIGDGVTPWNSLGYAGLKGATGATGLQGATGASGPTGIQGFTGVTGVQGLTGPTGSTGAAGQQGVTGSTGATGMTGTQGVTGPTGSIDPNPSFSSITVNGTTSVRQIQEFVSTYTAPSGTVAFNWSNGAIFYVSAMTTSFTANVNNLPTVANRSYVTTFILRQGATPYYTSSLQINGTSNYINWVNASAPAPTASRTEVESFTHYYTGISWITMGQLTSFG